MASSGPSSLEGSQTSSSDISEGEDKLLITDIPEAVLIQDIAESFGWQGDPDMSPVKLISYPIRPGTALVKFYKPSDRYRWLAIDKGRRFTNIKHHRVQLRKFPVQLFSEVHAHLTIPLELLDQEILNIITERTGLEFHGSVYTGLKLIGSWYRIQSARVAIRLFYEEYMNKDAVFNEVFDNISAYADRTLQWMIDVDVLQALSSRKLYVEAKDRYLIFRGSWDGIEHCYDMIQEQYDIYQEKERALEEQNMSSGGSSNTHKEYNDDSGKTENEIASVHQPHSLAKTAPVGLDCQNPAIKTEIEDLEASNVTVLMEKMKYEPRKKQCSNKVDEDTVSTENVKRGTPYSHSVTIKRRSSSSVNHETDEQLKHGMKQNDSALNKADCPEEHNMGSSELSDTNENVTVETNEQNNEIILETSGGQERITKSLDKHIGKSNLALDNKVNEVQTIKNDKGKIGPISRKNMSIQTDTLLSEIDELEFVASERDTLSCKIKDMEKSTCELKTKITNYERTVKESIEEIRKLKTRINDQEHELKQSIERHQKQIPEIRKLKQQVTILTSKLEKTEQSLTAKEGESNNIQERFLKVQKEKRELEHQVEELKLVAHRKSSQVDMDTDETGSLEYNSLTIEDDEEGSQDSVRGNSKWSYECQSAPSLKSNSDIKPPGFAIRLDKTKDIENTYDTKTSITPKVAIAGIGRGMPRQNQNPTSGVVGKKQAKSSSLDDSNKHETGMGSKVEKEGNHRAKKGPFVPEETRTKERASSSSSSDFNSDANEEVNTNNGVPLASKHEPEQSISEKSGSAFKNYYKSRSSDTKKTGEVTSLSGPKSEQVHEENTGESGDKCTLQMERIVLKYLRKKKNDKLLRIRDEFNVTFEIKLGDQHCSLKVLPGKGRSKSPQIEGGYDALIDQYQNVALTTSQEKINASEKTIKGNSKVTKIVEESAGTDVLINIDDNMIEIMGPKKEVLMAKFKLQKALGYDVKTREEEENEISTLKNTPYPRSTHRQHDSRDKSSMTMDGRNTLKFTTTWGIKVSVYKGDITSQTTDVIVNAANAYLKHGGGVAGAIASAGGYKVQLDSDDLMKRRSNKPLNVSEAVYTKVPDTKSNKLKCKYIVHAVGPRWDKYHDKAKCQDLLMRTFYNSLETASSLRAESVTIPAISSGIFGVPRDICVESMYNALITFSQDRIKKSKLKDVRFVNIDEETTKDIVSGFSRFLEGASSTSPHEPIKERSPGGYKTTNQSYGSHSSMSYASAASSGSGARPKTASKHETPATGIPCVQCSDGTLGTWRMDCNHWYCYSCKEYLAKDPSVRNCVMCTKGRQKDTPVDDLKDEDKCIICLERMVKPKMLEKCGHSFCKDCIDEWMKKSRPQCPVCGVSYGKRKGDQPKGGTMSSRKMYMSLPGYDGCGHIEINYSIPNGTQESIHPSPGKNYRGVHWTAYLPDNKEGNEIAALLKKAFDARLIFTIGQSRTRGTEDVVTWNDIHHKTKIYGGPSHFGYPDPDYLSRVRAELADKGIE